MKTKCKLKVTQCRNFVNFSVLGGGWVNHKYREHGNRRPLSSFSAFTEFLDENLIGNRTDHRDCAQQLNNFNFWLLHIDKNKTRF